MSLGITSLATTFCVLTHLCGVKGSQGVFRVSLEELSGPSRPRFGLVKGWLCIAWACKGKMTSVLEPHKLSLLQILPSDLSQQEGATRSWEGGNNGSPVIGGECW